MAKDESINYNELTDYGVVMVMDNDTTISTAAEFLERPDAYVFSKTNGEAQISGKVITAAFTKNIYTYMLDSDI